MPSMTIGLGNISGTFEKCLKLVLFVTWVLVMNVTSHLSVDIIGEGTDTDQTRQRHTTNTKRY